MTTIPSDRSLDGTLALIRDPYHFIPKRCRALGSDVFRTRLLLRPTICMSGAAAGHVFYDERRFRRRGAAPRPAQATLFGVGGVQGLDDEAHRHRRQLFLDATGPRAVDALAETFASECRRAVESWRGLDRIALYDAIRPVLTRAVCAWAGVPVPESEVPLRTRQLTSMFENADTLALRHWRARRDRREAERWLADLVRRERRGDRTLSPGSIAGRFAWHRTLDGQLLEPRIAAVELLNVLRPTVAVSVYITLAAHALHEHPEHVPQLHDADARRRFAQEVRRTYPFFPFVGAVVREDFQWRGMEFAADTRVLFDLHGTNRDPEVWSEPESFRPDRFLTREPDAFSLVPQGGGDRRSGHRCPGEPATLALLDVALQFLATEVRYAVPPQDLALDDSRMPALPGDGFVIEGVALRA